MKDSLNNIRQKLSDYLTNLTKSQKIKLSSIVLGSIILLVVLTIVFTRPITVPLYSSPLAEDKAAQVAAELDTLKYSYSLEPSAGGEIINVDQSQKEKIKLALSEAGLPKGKGYTYEDAINGDSISTPSEVRQSKFLLAKQDEIAQTLTQIDGIKDATVNLNIPEKAVFAEDQNTSKPTAAIHLTLDNTLSDAQVKGVVDFVAKSVENLDSKNIVVIDQEGNQLYGGKKENSDSNSTNSQFALKVKNSEYYKKQVEDLFSQLGMKDVKVNVNLSMNFDTQVTDSIVYTTSEPNGKGYIDNQTTSTESGTGVEGSQAVGTSSNVTIQYPSTNGNNYSMNKKTNQVKYNIDKTRKKTQLAMGTVDPTKSSIAVMLYKRGKVYTDKTAYDKAVSTVKNMSQFTATVKNATGFSNVTIQQAEVPVYEPSAGIDFAKLFSTYAPFALATIILLGLLAGFLKGDKKKKQSQEEIDVEEYDMEQDSPDAIGGPSFEARIGAEEELPDIEVSKDSEVQNQINKFVKEKPDAVAQLLKNWLNEDWE